MEDETLDFPEAIGFTLIGIQFAERFLGILLRTAFIGQTAPTVEELEQEEEFVWRATLGRLINRLNERVELDSEFEEHLVQFRDDRNFFVHHLIDLATAGESQEEHTRKILDFCKRVRTNSFRLTHLFIVVLHKWSISLEPDEPMDEEIKRSIKQVAEDWPKSTDELFRVRES